MRDIDTGRPEAKTPSRLLRATGIGHTIRFIAMTLSSLLGAHVASAQGPGALVPNLQTSPRRIRDVASASASTPAIVGLSLHGTESGEAGSPFAHDARNSYSGPLQIRPAPEFASRPSTAPVSHLEALVLGTRVENVPPVSFRRSNGDAFLSIGPVSGDFQTPVQLVAAFGLRDLSFRVSSWRRLGSGPSVNARTLSVVRNLNLPSTGANTGLAVSVTMYRLGSRFDAAYGRRPVSIHFLFRIRFGFSAASRISPVDRSRNL